MGPRAVIKAIGRFVEGKGEADPLIAGSDTGASGQYAAVVERLSQSAGEELRSTGRLDQPARAEGHAETEVPLGAAESGDDHPPLGLSGAAAEPGTAASQRLAKARAASAQQAGTLPPVLASLAAVLAWKQALELALVRELGDEPAAEQLGRVRRALATCTITEIDEMLTTADRLRPELVEIRRALEVLARWRRLSIRR
jgi:hypothetical protein